MAYIGKSIEEVMNMIGDNRMYLPSIQRKFVWNDYDVEKLLDSIMLGYPIGTFLFWKIKRKIAKEKKYTLYKFINDYSELDNKNINEKAPDNLPGESEYIYSVLDGQQRLTSMYIAFHGSIALCGYKKKKSKAENYIKRQMYLNLNKSSSSEVEDEDLKYEFKFLSEQEVESEKVNHPDKNWYRIKDIFSFDDNKQLVKYIIGNGLNDIAQDNLTRLFEVAKAKGENSIINYFEINENTPFDSILNIFVRVNDGGKKLSKSDLLFSTVVSNWEKGREEIEDLINVINQRGQKFDFNSDFIMRSCLYLVCTSSDLKIENLGKANIQLINSNWKSIKDSIIKTIDLLVSFGFCSENLISRNVVMPLIYYIYKGGLLDESSKYEMRKYLIIAQLKQLFGAAGNSALSKTRKALDEHKISKDGFKLDYFKDLKFVSDRDFSIKDEDLEKMLDYDKGTAYAFMVLSLLYPELKLSQIEWHQDHMHPDTKFKTTNLKNLGISDEKIEEWQLKRNKIPNLQLLEGKENESKNKQDLEEWLSTHTAKYLPENISYKLDNFDQFFEKRKELLKTELKRILS
jgi:uncharacterized protein with ParB-like and HNH nuclease domain